MDEEDIGRKMDGEGLALNSLKRVWLKMAGSQVKVFAFACELGSCIQDTDRG